MRVLVVGGTGTAGRATVRALAAGGHEVTCLVRSRRRAEALLPPGVERLACDVSDPSSVRRALRGRRFDAWVCALASRTGAPAEAWAIDYRASALTLEATRERGATRAALVSAICVQRPRLAFQHAKLALERHIARSGPRYSIVRPTAFHKSLSGQVERVRRGRPFLIFGDGTLTRCKPIGDDDLGDYLAGCLVDPARRNRILPIGAPGAVITPREQGETLFALAGRAPRFRQVPVGLFDVVGGVLDRLGRLSPACAEKAELARIGRYYATESMLVLDPLTGRYDADATPSTGTETLRDFHAALLDGTASVERGTHAVFRE